jgi:2-haloalkanoic acid dehalogenase type II
MQDIKAISFDCYGTLVDWETGIRAAFKDLFAGMDIDASEETLLELFAKHESELEARVPIIAYWNVLDQVAAGVAKDIGVDISSERTHGFADSIGNWPLYDDVLPMLELLHGKFVLAILSNVDRRCFAVTEDKFKGMIDVVCIAEESGAYKPSFQAFEALLDILQEKGVGKDGLLHVAQSLFHDHEPAAKLGIKSCWADRRADQDGWGAVPPPEGSVQPPYRVKTLADLPGLIADAE